MIGGVTVGYDFVNSGFGAYAYPDWMKYFSFALDYTYNRLTIQDGGPGIGQFFAGNSRMNGSESALTFLFMFHYGFLPDSEVPSGRINPYLGIGPAIVWTSVQGTMPIFCNSQWSFGQARSSNFGDDTMNVALVVEPGVRFMVLRNVSIDVAMRYRYSAPSYSDKASPSRRICTSLPRWFGPATTSKPFNLDCIKGGLRAAFFLTVFTDSGLPAVSARFSSTYAAQCITALWSAV